MSLQSLSLECIRRHWNIYEDIIDDYYFDLIFNDWKNKFHKNITSFSLDIIRKFITDKVSNISIFYLSGKQRKNLHFICDRIGLFHITKVDRLERYIYIYKPELWIWEFSEENPVTNCGKVVYDEIQDKKNLELLSRKYCGKCLKRGPHVDQLYHGDLYCRLLCETCVQTYDNGIYKTKPCPF